MISKEKFADPLLFRGNHTVISNMLQQSRAFYKVPHFFISSYSSINCNIISMKSSYPRYRIMITDVMSTCWKSTIVTIVFIELVNPLN